MTYETAIHHRRSIRLKGHDYAGGGMYFVTICAHRKAGDIFAPESVKAMVAHEWESAAGEAPVGAGLVPARPSQEGTHVGAGLVPALPSQEGTHEGCPYVIMPDHVHGVVRMRRGDRALGDVVGAFKSRVVHEYIAHVKHVKAGRWPPFPGKIWHRNYYERIIRSDGELANVQNYIRMNPWRLVQHAKHEGRSCQMIGNPCLLNREKVAMLCSRNCPAQVLAAARERAASATQEYCVISGFHSPPEKAILEALLQSEAKIICCPAWGIDEMKIPSDWLPALEQNRMLILEMLNRAGNLAAAEERNAFVLTTGERQWIPHCAPGGMLARLLQDVGHGAVSREATETTRR